MMLIGTLDSPYAQRVSVTLKHHDIRFEHANWSVGADLERIRESSPLGRVPAKRRSISCTNGWFDHPRNTTRPGWRAVAKR